MSDQEAAVEVAAADGRDFVTEADVEQVEAPVADRDWETRNR